MLFQPSKLSKYMGMDVTSLMSVPLFIMEPFSMLQKMAEITEYTSLLDQADAAEDPYERCEGVCCGANVWRTATRQHGEAACRVHPGQRSEAAGGAGRGRTQRVGAVL